MRTFTGLAELKSAVGEHLGYSDWHEVTQEMVDMFAEATGDHQWIHVDQEKAAAGPFGSTIAHGYLTLSLIPGLSAEVYEITGITMGINYGSNKVRFTNPVPTGSRVRAGFELVSVDTGPKGSQMVTKVIIEIEGQDRPACVAETVAVIVP